MIKSINQSPFPIFKWNQPPKRKRVNKNQPYTYTRVIRGKTYADHVFQCADKAFNKPFKVIEYKGIEDGLYEFRFTLNMSIKDVDGAKRK